MFFYLYREFYCECGGVCWFSAGSVHFGFVILLTVWSEMMRKSAKSIMSIFIIFFLSFFSSFF